MSAHATKLDEALTHHRAGRLSDAADAYQRLTDWHTRRPVIG